MTRVPRSCSISRYCTRDAHARDRSLGLDCHRFVSRVVHDRQALDDPALGRANEYEVRRPGLVGCNWSDSRLACARHQILAFASPHLQRRLLVRPFNARALHDQSALRELETNHPNAVAAVSVGRREDPLSQLPIVARQTLQCSRRPGNCRASMPPAGERHY